MVVNFYLFCLNLSFQYLHTVSNPTHNKTLRTKSTHTHTHTYTTHKRGIFYEKDDTQRQTFQTFGDEIVKGKIKE